MEESTDSFEEVTGRLRAGHPSAAEEVFLRYTHRLVGLARKRLPAEVARKVGPDDVMQSVFNSFFARFEKGQFDQIGDWNEFWRLLAHITALKCNHKIAEFHAQRRDVRREVNFQKATDESGPTWEAESPDPTASEAAMLVELVDVLLRDLDPRDQRIIQLALEGQRPSQIAKEVERSERTVERVLEKLRKRLEQMRDDSR